MLPFIRFLSSILEGCDAKTALNTIENNDTEDTNTNESNSNDTGNDSYVPTDTTAPFVRITYRDPDGTLWGSEPPALDGTETCLGEPDSNDIVAASLLPVIPYCDNLTSVTLFYDGCDWVSHNTDTSVAAQSIIVYISPSNAAAAFPDLVLANAQQANLTDEEKAANDGTLYDGRTDLVEFANIIVDAESGTFDLPVPERVAAPIYIVAVDADGKRSAPVKATLESATFCE